MADTTASILRGVMSNMRIPSASDKVYKDECVYSFDSPFSDSGLYVNLVSMRGFGGDYLQQDIAKGGRAYLHQKWTQVEKEVQTKDEAVTKLAIGVSGGFVTESKWDIVKEHWLVVVTPSGELRSVALPDAALPEYVSNVIQGVIEHDGMRTNMGVSSWDADNEKFESKFAADLQQLNPSNRHIPQDPKMWKDEATGATDNLWLNLSTGYIGGGRKNWDGSGGSGSALTHYEETGRKYPLAVKLGTITAHGADVWSYSAEEDALVVDSKLPEHLSFWGIDAMKLEKTEKTMGEMEVSLNMSYDWTRILDGAEELELLSGPGLLGLRNIGSSCYMNSVMQAFLAIPEVQGRYLSKHQAIVATAPEDPTTDFPTQLSKLALGVLSARYVPDASTSASAAAPTPASGASGEEGGKVCNLEKYVLAPRMFKHLVGKGHAEFSSGRQQDVSEYFQYLLETMGKAERVHLGRVTDSARTTSSLFEYYCEERYQNSLGEVKYTKGPKTLSNMLDLAVPRDLWEGGGGQAAKRARTGTDTEMETEGAGTGAGGGMGEDELIPFEACLQQYLQSEEVDMYSTSAGRVVPCTKSTRFSTFPRYMMVKVARYFAGPNWVQQKITARIDVPDVLDLSAYRGGGRQPNEAEMPDDDRDAGGTGAGGGAGAGDAAAGGEFAVSEELVGVLMSMGFSENGCRRAAIATNNADAEVAMNWVMEHMEDEDFNSPPPAAGADAAADAGGVNAEAVAMLGAMGYSDAQTAAALKATDNNIERAADWLFSHMDDLDAAVAEMMGGAGAGGAGGAEAGVGANGVEAEDGEGKYTLMAVISHIGKSTDHGHYVCHIKKNGAWVLFNDEKVGRCKRAPVEYGFMYLYRRDDAPSDF